MRNQQSCLQVETLLVRHAFITSMCCIKSGDLYQACKWVLYGLKCILCWGRIMHDRVSWKQFCWFLDEVQVKNYPDFFQLLVAFRYSNICYYASPEEDKGGRFWISSPYFLKSWKWQLLHMTCSYYLLYILMLWSAHPQWGDMSSKSTS